MVDNEGTTVVGQVDFIWRPSTRSHSLRPARTKRVQGTQSVVIVACVNYASYSTITRPRMSLLLASNQSLISLRNHKAEGHIFSEIEASPHETQLEVHWIMAAQQGSDV